MASKLNQFAKQRIKKMKESEKKNAVKFGIGAAIGVVTSLVAAGRFPPIFGQDPRLVVGAAGSTFYKARGKWGSAIKGWFVGVLVPPAVEIAQDQVVPAIERNLPGLEDPTLPTVPETLLNQPTTRPLQ